MTLRIVLADDSVLLREGIARLLAEAGFEVVAQAGDADGLLAAVREHAPDVAIVDIRMPPTHTDEGLRAAEAIRAEHGTAVGVLVLSQYVETTFALRLVADGAGGIGYLLKDRVDDLEDFADADPPDRPGRLGDRSRGRRPAGRPASGARAARRPDRARARGPRADGRGPLEPGDLRPAVPRARRRSRRTSRTSSRSSSCFPRPTTIGGSSRSSRTCADSLLRHHGHARMTAATQHPRHRGVRDAPGRRSAAGHGSRPRA